MHRIVFAAAVAAALPVFAADLTVASRVPAPGSDGPVVQHLWASDQFVRISQPAQECIIEAATGKMLMIEPGKGTYYETSFQEIGAWVDAKIPRNRLVRGMMKRMFAGLAVEKQADRKTIAGFECAHYTEKVGDGVYHVWATDAIKAPTAYYDVMERAFQASSPLGNPMSPIYAKLRADNAVPLEMDLMTTRVRLADALNAGITTMLQGVGVPTGPVRVPAYEDVDVMEGALEVSNAPIEPATFQLPEGLTRLASPYASKGK